MDILCIKPNDVMINPNITPSWGSITTDCVCAVSYAFGQMYIKVECFFVSIQAAIIACKELKARMKEVEVTMSNPTWIELVQECYNRGVDITVRHM
jgi:predicted peroxiredoxin